MHYTPAERAGLRADDVITLIDDTPATGLTLDAIVQRLRGPVDSQVRLTVERTGTPDPIVVTLKREHVVPETVVYEREGDVAVIRMYGFNAETSGSLEHEIERAEQEIGDDLVGYILDLRNNPGGLLDAAIDVCNEFFEDGELIVYTQGRTPETREDFNADNGHHRRTYPIAILVNGGTASAAEIVSGAMKDTKRAVIVGEKTFGKGSVQSIIELENGEGLRLTTARYYTPSGITIHEKGIQPQVELEISADDESKLRLQQSRPDLTEPVEFNERFGFQRIEDLQLNAAEEVLQGVLAARAK
jgi:carboxyl-terminal processing protease